jgi:hypothetical protein
MVDLTGICPALKIWKDFPVHKNTKVEKKREKC